MKLFGAPISPFVRKVLAYAAEKGIELEMVPTGLGDHPPEFLAASPFKKMPGFCDGDFAISDSTAIITYLEAKFPEPPLLPADPAERARTIWFEEFTDTMMSAAGGKVFFNRVVSPKFLGKEGDEEMAKLGEKELEPFRDYLEGVLPDSGYFVGDRLTLADIAIASVFVNLDHVGLGPDPKVHPKLTAFVEKMHARPSFATWIPRERKMLGLT